MKIRFIYPRFEKFLESRSELGSLAISKNTGNFMMPPALGIPILAALTPDEYEFCLSDENIEEINYDDDSDLIAVSFFTPQASHAYEIAKRFSKKGKTVIGGGMHPSIMPKEASLYFDAICVGEAENVWLKMLDDFANNRLKKIYYGNYPDLNSIPIPDRNIYKSNPNYDWGVALIQASRGCRYHCEGCIIPAQCGKDFRFRSVENVITEMVKVNARDYYFIDDTLVLLDDVCQDYTKKLFTETSLLSPKPRIFLSGSLSMRPNSEYLKMLYKGGVFCIYIVCGSDPVSMSAFQRKGRFHIDKGIEVINKIRDAGINVFLSQGFGFDFQDEYVFDATLEFIEKTKLDTAEFFIFTPFPETPAWQRFNVQDRILHYNWTHYNSAHVVFKPNHFTEQQLIDGYLYCWKEFYKNKPLDRPTSIFTKLMN